MTNAANGLPQPLHRKPLTSIERAKLRMAPPTNRVARAKGDPVATARLLAALDGGARPICQV
jgi:hypothetical protein